MVRERIFRQLRDFKLQSSNNVMSSLFRFAGAFNLIPISSQHQNMLSKVCYCCKLSAAIDWMWAGVVDSQVPCLPPTLWGEVDKFLALEWKTGYIKLQFMDMQFNFFSDFWEKFKVNTFCWISILVNWKLHVSTDLQGSSKEVHKDMVALPVEGAHFYSMIKMTLTPRGSLLSPNKRPLTRFMTRSWQVDK